MRSQAMPNMLPPVTSTTASNSAREDFHSALRTGVLWGAAALMVVLPALHYWKTPIATAVSNAPLAMVEPATSGPAAPAPVGDSPGAAFRLASFGGQKPTDAVRHVANWSVYSGDHQKMAVVIVDKRDARVWVFDPQGKLISATPALLGSAIGDDTIPGIGDRPLSLVKPDEKTTPAGRFVAEPGFNTNGEDIVWVDYDAAVSMHRVRPNVKAERRLERLASPSSADNRITFGCINLPKTFYETVLSPTVNQFGAVVYVLPETRTPAEVFGSYDVPPATHLAQR
ncbi:MAG: hypothetical protein LH617_04765 [Ramlibacter sp.]|nr:hypothetical protein [Ramlibacter sp.]